MKPIRIAQYGIGHNHGAEKMNALRRFPEAFEVLGVCEPNEKWRRERENTPAYRGLPFLSEAEFFQLPGLEAACVETDVPELDRAARKCIDRGLHIHMDKPGGENLAEFRAMMNAARVKGLTVQMGYMYRYNPAIQKALSLAKEGALGDIFEIDAQMSTCHPLAYRQWLSQFAGGTMYIFGCHLLDMVLAALGTDYARIVPFPRMTRPDEARVYDNGLAVVEYPSATCTVRTTSLEVNGYGRRQLVICGTRGTVEVKPLEKPTRVCVSFLKDNPPTYQDSHTVLDIPVEGERYDRQVLDFAAYIRGEKQNPYSYDYEIALQKATLEACGAYQTEE